MIRVIVVHQTRLIASLIASVLTEEEGIFVVGLATSVEEALGKVARSNCNMMLVAATLPNQGALSLTREMVKLDPSVKVMVIGMPDSENMILQYVMAGAAGYVLQDVTTERLLENIWAAHNEKALISPDIAAKLIQQLAELARLSTQRALDPMAVDELTPRERDVLTLIGEGMTNQEIADRLVVEVGTVKTHVHNILKKLDVSNREDAAAYLHFLDDDQETAVSDP
ncbi:MAG: response regulator transcription factor [Anaerolineaceae bacterium]|nr:response regulator transcription factor [Anaerolineaceae bacterium]